MADVIAIVAMIWESLQHIMSTSAPVINWLGLVTFFGWGFVYPFMGIVRRVFLYKILEAKPDAVERYY